MKHGVNIYGYVNAESGVGEHTRLLISSVREAGIDYSVIPFEVTMSRQQSRFDDAGSGSTDFAVNIIGVNADQIEVFRDHFGPDVLDGRHNIALWAWELEDFPDWMAASARHLDEIWANSSFSAKAIAQKVTCPVFPFPLPIRTPDPDPISRYELGLPEGFLFLFCFDFDSVFARKNPLAVIEAFSRAFPDRGAPEAWLLIKSINGDRHPDHMDALASAARNHRSIMLRDGYLSNDQQDRLMGACDAYVSLHRSEGFGLTLAEAMALGKPVIATGFSGNMDFMNEHNSFLVPHDFVAVGDENDPYPKDCRWADTDIDVAAEIMRYIASMPEIVAEKTAQARRDIARLHSPEVRSRFVAERLHSIFASTALER